MSHGLHRLTASLEMPVPLEEVFPFFAAAGNLERITPPQLRFRITTPEPVRIQKGTLIDYSLSLYGMKFGWRTLISEWNPPHAFVDEQLRGPYKVWRHRHSFEATQRGTLMRDAVDYALPLFPLGELALPVVRLQVKGIFTFRQKQVMRLFGVREEDCVWSVEA